MLKLLQAETEAAAAARELADQSVKAAASSKVAEEEQRTACQVADTQLATVQSQLEETQRAQQRAQEQQYNAEEVLSVKLALLQSMAQRFAQAGEAKRKAAELQVKAQERIASADEDMRALGQQLMYAAAGKLQSNSDTKTAYQGETSGGAPTQGQGTDAQPDNETAVLQTNAEAPVDTAAHPNDEVTLQLQLNKTATQHTEQAGMPIIDDTQEELNANAITAEEERPKQEEAESPKSQSSSSQATSASTSPSMQSSSKGIGGDENVNNNSMDVDGLNDEVEQKPDRSSAISKAHSRSGDQKATATVHGNAVPSLALRLPETAVYGQNTVNNTLDEFDGMA